MRNGKRLAISSTPSPCHWSTKNEKGNGIIPEERDARSIGCHLYYLIWETPLINFREDLPNHVLCFIESYQKIDKASPITLKEVEELEMKKISGPIRLCSKTRIKSNKNQERFVIVQKSQEYDKTWNIYRVYYLLQQDDDMVHCVTIRMRENYAKKNPGKIEEIKRILDSFTIKGERRTLPLSRTSLVSFPIPPCKIRYLHRNASLPHRKFAQLRDTRPFGCIIYILI